MKRQKIEHHILLVSLFSTLFQAVIGISLGLILNSAFVIFESVYDFLSVLTTFLTLKLVGYIVIHNERLFPYGKEKIKPLVVTLQYTILLITIIYAIYGGFEQILAGGVEVNLEGVILYMIFSAMSTVIISCYLHRQQQKASSTFATSETKQWIAAAVMSVSTLLGYLFAQLLVRLNVPQITPYIDPIILIIVGLVLIRTPIIEIIKAVQQLIDMSDSEQPFNRRIRDDIIAVTNRYAVKKPYIRISITGDVVYVEVDCVVDRNYPYDRIADQDRIRLDIDRALAWLEQEIWLSVAFTHDKKWAEA
jgi:predicted Co/Zn/Cd cation transporter (cation efflux family)